jgi:hypothetical protein
MRFERITGDPESAGIKPHERYALTPGHENRLFLGALTRSSWPLMIKPIAEVRTLPDWWRRPRG